MQKFLRQKEDCDENLAAKNGSALSTASTSSETTWEAGAPVPYLALVETFDAISNVSGRLDKENLFSRLFQQVIQKCKSASSWFIVWETNVPIRPDVSAHWFPIL